MHIRSLVTVTILSTVITSACSESKKEEAAPKTREESATAEKAAPAPTKPPPATTTTHELTDFGYVIETPADWGFRTLDPSIYIFDLKSVKTGAGVIIIPRVTITKAPGWSAPSTVEAAGKRCSVSGKLLDKGSVANTAVFHNCETEIAGAKILKAEYFIVEGESVLVCSASGLDMATMNKACASMRKK